MPEIFLSCKIFKYITFFFIGMYCSQYYVQIKNTLSRYVWMLTLFFIVFNLCLIDRLNKMPFVWDVVLPLIGSSLFFGVAIKIGKRKDGTSKVWKALVGYIEYCGKFSLQFYLLTFAYPIIRFVTVKFVSDPVLIVLIVFILQLIAVTILVEITRRIKYLRIPLGY